MRNLLGERPYEEPIEGGYGDHRGERWQTRSTARWSNVTMMAGKVGDIRIDQR